MQTPNEVPVTPTEPSLSGIVDALAVAIGEQCPECGSRMCEDNGATEYRCADCDHRWGTDAGESYGY